MSYSTLKVCSLCQFVSLKTMCCAEPTLELHAVHAYDLPLDDGQAPTRLLGFEKGEQT